MGNDNLSGIGGLLGIIILIALFFGAGKLFPALGTLLLIGGGIFLALIILIVVLIIVFTKKSGKEQKKGAISDEQNAILKKGRQNLLEMKKHNMSIRNQQIRSASGDICRSVDEIFRELKEQPEDIPNLRQFFNYYLPTCEKILSKYAMLEKKGIPSADITESTIACLADIREVVDKQYQNLFEDDLLDLSVEMEALRVSCKRDGLLSEEDFKVDKNNISLTL